MAVSLSRRTMLAAAAGLLASACGRPTSAHPPSSSAAAPVQYPIAVPGATPQDLAAFAAYAPGVKPLPVPKSPATTPQWEIAPTEPFLYSAAFSALDAALRQVNFDVSVLLTGAYTGFASHVGGTALHYAVPTFAVPWGVQYDASVFRTVGLDDPAPDWSLEAFEGCCAAIAAAMQAGHLPNLQSVLPPLLGGMREVRIGTRSQTVMYFGPFTDPTLQGGFVEGFGGTVVTGGRFDLTNTGAIAGLQRMVDLATRFGPPAGQPAGGPSALHFTKAASTFVKGSAMPAPLPDPKTWRWARFPRFPVDPVVPTRAGGVTVSRAAPEIGFPITPPVGVPDEALLAVAEYALWRYDQARRTPALPDQPPPVLADPAVQQSYWSAPRLAANDYAAVGDWPHFRMIGADWPMALGGITAPIHKALTTAADSGTPISHLVAQATQQLNSGLKPPTVGSLKSSAGGA